MATDATAIARRSEPAPGSERTRLEWSKWTRCETSFNLLLVPQKPGVYAIAEEVPPAGGQTSAQRRVLAVQQFLAAEDLARALGRLFTPASPFYERVAAGGCFFRYAVAEDPEQRACALEALQGWLAESAETAPPGRSCQRVAERAPLPAGF